MYVIDRLILFVLNLIFKILAIARHVIMKRVICAIIFLLIAGCIQAALLEAYWMWTPETGQWINPKWAVKSTPEDQYIWANENFQDEDYDRAAREFRNLAINYPFSEYAPEAQFMCGESYMREGKYYEAYQEFQRLIVDFPSSKRIEEAIDKEFQAANHFFYMDKKSWKDFIPVFPTLKPHDVAMEIYQQVVKNAPFGPFADDAQYKIGETYLKQGDYTKAVESYEKLIKNYPESDLAEIASYKIALTASQGLYTVKGNIDAQAKALEEFNAFSKEYPDSALIDEAKKEIDFLRNENAQKLYGIALFYEKNKGYKAAEFYYNKVLNEFGETEWSSQAGMRLTNMALKLKEKE